MTTVSAQIPHLIGLPKPSESELLSRWLSLKATSTQQVYFGAITQLKNWCDAPLLTLNSLDLEAFQHYLQTKDLAATTIRNKLSFISSFYSWCVKHDILQRNPCCALTRPRTNDTLVERILSNDEVEQIFANAKTDRDRLFFQCLYYLGLRLSEACAIRVGDIIAGQPYRLRIVGKGGQNRYENIHPKILPALLARAKEVSKFGGAQYGADYYIFPFGRKRGHEIIKEAATPINPDISCHWLRHSYATHSLQGGADIELVRRSLGHANIATTSKYLHALPGASASDFLD